MFVIKRNGQSEAVQFDKILFRMRAVAEGLRVDSTLVAQKVVSGLFNGIQTTEIDSLIAETAAVMATEHPDYSRLASRVAISNLHKATKSFYQTMKDLFKAGILSSDFIKLVKLHGKQLEKLIDYNRDFELDFFGFKTLEKSYLLKIHDKVVERPQHLFMRVALQVSGESFEEIVETYDLISKGLYTHATPTLFNSGCTRPQLGSCFLMEMQDSVDGIYDALKECAQISKYAGGIGIHIHDIRAKGSLIKGTGGKSTGLLPTLKPLDATARFINQGGKRNGSIAVYLEPWHADIEEFIGLRKNTGMDNQRCRDLFLALWINDLFMQRVEEDGIWSLMSPDECPGLPDVYDAEFAELYTSYEEQGKYRKQIKARELMTKFVETMIECGVPYFLFKDAANRKSNQKNIGIIKSSNLCLSGDTLVLTKTGAEPIADLVGKEVEIFDGEQWVLNKSFRKTAENAQVFRVTFADNSSVICTPSHKWVLDTGEFIEAHSLSVGDVLKVHNQVYIYRTTPRCAVVKGIEELEEEQDVYCTTVDTTHKFALANGLMTGNCTEIMEVSTPYETAVCNLASLCLPKYVEDGKFNHAKLHKVVKSGTKNLNHVIDRTFYPLKKTSKSNFAHRPIGIGVQGLADVFFLLDLAFDSPEARTLNALIFETIYHAALEASCELSEKYGSYSTFAGSPASQGILQFDMWNVTPTQYDWDGLKERIKKGGLRNSLLIAPMPTASTASVFGNNECFEAQTSNVYKRQVLAGEYVVINKHLIKKLEKLGLWDKEMRDEIISSNGSIQNISSIPDDVKSVYKTVWEISQKVVIDLAADRGAFIDQSQSMNLFLSSPTVAQLNSALFYGWKKGLKTGMYYLRTNAAMQAQKVTTKILDMNNEEQMSCSLDNPQDCIACSS